MKLLATVFGLTLVLVFGVISAIDHSSTASAVPAQTMSVDNCHDDGDDDAAGSDEPVDAPDSEENPSSVGENARNDEFGDSEDHDPGYEADDEAGCNPGAVLGETASPSPTPCPTFNDVGAAGGCCVPSGSVNADLIGPCYCQFGGGAEVGAEGPGLCCIINPFLCCDSVDGPDVGAEGPGDPCCIINPINCIAVQADPPADVDCDGSVTALDAYASLGLLSGSSAETAGCTSGGDADCSGAVDALDTLAILKILAGVSEPATC